ncbi:predicted protein [Postia placenta Mad-698-R]|nr:predicted protein [Postia placenta Mad-698-R]
MGQNQSLGLRQFENVNMRQIVVGPAVDMPPPMSHAREDTPAKNQDESKPTMPDSDSGDEPGMAWETCAEQVWKREEELVKNWKEEIDRLLTFAGLFSAALTAFNVQYYVTLQPPAASVDTQAILAIITTLAVARDGDTVHPLLCALSTTPSIPTPSMEVVIINTLWFSALVFSLSAASIAISVSQWLYHHIDRAASKSRESVRLWYFRHSMFEAWQIPIIISLLPLLLQISLALFLIGLVQLLWTMNQVVATVVTALAVTLLSLSMITAVLPAFVPSCPYKSQPALWCFSIMRRARRIPLAAANILLQLRTYPDRPLLRNNDNNHPCSFCLRLFGRISHSLHIRNRLTHLIHLILKDRRTEGIQEWRRTQRGWLRTSNWRDIDNMSVRLQLGNAEGNLEMLAAADATVMDDALLKSVVGPCLLEAQSIQSVLPVFYQILERRAQDVDTLTDPPTFIWPKSEQDAAANRELTGLCVNLLGTYLQQSGSEGFEGIHLRRHLVSFIQAMPPDAPHLQHLASLVNNIPLEASKTISCCIMQAIHEQHHRPEITDAHRGIWGILPVSFIHNIVRASIQPGGLRLDTVLNVYHSILRHRIDGIDYLLGSSRNTRALTPSETDAVIAMLQVSLDTYAVTGMQDDRTELNQQRAQILRTVEYLLADALAGVLEANAANPLLDLLKRLASIIEAMRPEESRDTFCCIMRTFHEQGYHSEASEMICGTRKLLAYLPYICKRIEGKGFWRIMSAAVWHAGGLSPNEYALVSNDMPGWVDAAVKYLDSHKTQELPWWHFLDFLKSFVRLSQMDHALLTQGAAKVFVRAASQAPHDYGNKKYVMNKIHELSGHSADSSPGVFVKTPATR